MRGPVPSQIELHRRMFVNTIIPDFVLNALARDCGYKCFVRNRAPRTVPLLLLLPAVLWVQKLMVADGLEPV
jgi:hypothetical protein